MKNKIFKAVIVIIIIIVTAFVLLFSFRNSVLQYLIVRFQDKFKTGYHATLSIKEARFTDFNTVQIAEVSVIPDQRDTLIKIKSISSSINYFKAVFGSIILTKLSVDNVLVNIVEQDSINNYMFLFRKKSQEKKVVKETDYAATFNRLLESFFDKVPSAVDIRKVSIEINRNGEHFKMEMPSFNIADKKAFAQIIDKSSGISKKWILKGVIDGSSEKLNLLFYSESSQSVELPFLQSRFNLRVSCDTMNIALDNASYGSGELNLKGQARFNNLFVNHPKLSPNDIVIKNASIEYNTMFGKNWVSLDSSSVVTVNKVSFKPFLYFKKSSPKEKEVIVKLHSPKWLAQDFFESLPTGINQNLEGIQTEGYLTYNLDFDINTSKPDSLHFESGLVKDNFKILKYGATNIAKLNGAFTYTAYERSGPVRSFIVGPENPYYTPYEDISEYLKYALLTSEDGNFFYHKGFNQESFAKSIAFNLKKGRFAKGGSTISMQLVKNVFLTRNKTISRKLEEALIVWLIENNYVVSKQRMYEVYLNIIEWGPNIYGITEAAEFYFDKRPADLTLSESIYLASIVPNPKAFKYSFDKEGNLREFLAGYYKLVAGRLKRKNIITEDEYNSLEPNVILKGAAKRLVLPTDTVPENFIQGEEEQEGMLKEEGEEKKGFKSSVVNFFNSVFKKNKE